MDDLPGSLGLSSTLPFVGRAGRTGNPAGAAPRPTGAGRRIVLVGGEPGSGKSRLVREFAAEAAADGVLVLFGACDAVVRTPYGPFVEALDQLARVTDADELRAALGTGGGELTRLVPGLPARVGELPPPVEADPDTERHRLHTAVTELLWRSRPSDRCCSWSRTATGRTPPPCSCSAISPALGPARRTDADRRHLPRHRGRRPGRARRDARRPAAVRGRRPHAPRRASRPRR